MSDNSSDDTSSMSREDLEADIANTREDMEQTISALGEKLDVKKQVRGSVDDVRANVAAGVDHAKHVVSDGATQTANSDVVMKARANPVVPAAIAAGVVAAVVGLILWRRSR